MKYRTLPRTLPQIVNAVENAAGLPDGATSDLARRTRDVSLARHVIFYLARKETKLSFVSIARWFGLDHKSVMYGFNRVSRAVVEGTWEINSIIRRAAP